VENKGPILISYLSQIILIIILLQVSGALRGLTLFVALITEVLILSALVKEKKWDFQTWYAFFIFVIVLVFLLANVQPGTSEITPSLSVEIIVALILGFFITVFSQAPVEEPEVDIFDIEPKTKVISMPKKHAARRTAKRKAPAKKKTAKKKVPAKKKVTKKRTTRKK